MLSDSFTRVLNSTIAGAATPATWIELWKCIVSHDWFSGQLRSSIQFVFRDTDWVGRELDDAVSRIVRFKLARELQHSQDCMHHVKHGSVCDWLQQLTRQHCYEIKDSEDLLTALLNSTAPNDKMELSLACHALSEPAKSIVLLKLNGRSLSSIASDLGLTLTATIDAYRQARSAMS